MSFATAESRESRCAGRVDDGRSFVAEFAALSRLSGDEIFEIKTRQAMDYLWHKRHSGSSLMGHIIDVHSGDWIRRETGIGAGSDSYYEYVLKAYILLGDDTYLHRFHRHYESLLKYVLKGSRMADVHMHQPSSTSKPYLDALIAFFPGLQVLYGDVEPAKLSYQVRWTKLVFIFKIFSGLFLVFNFSEKMYYLCRAFDNR